MRPENQAAVKLRVIMLTVTEGENSAPLVLSSPGLCRSKLRKLLCVGFRYSLVDDTIAVVSMPAISLRMRSRSSGAGGQKRINKVESNVRLLSVQDLIRARNLWEYRNARPARPQECNAPATLHLVRQSSSIACGAKSGSQQESEWGDRYAATCSTAA